MQGAAWASLIGYALTTLIGLCFFARDAKEELRPLPPHIEPKLLLQTMLNGSSEMLTNLALSVTLMLLNFTMMQYGGADTVAALGVTLYIASFTEAMFYGFSDGIDPVFSYNQGEGDSNALRALFRICIRLLVILSGVLFGLLLLMRGWIADLYAADNAVLREMLMHGLLITAFQTLFVSINVFGSSLFTAFSQAGRSMVIAASRSVVFLLILLTILPKLFGLTGVWLVFPLTELCGAFITVFLLARAKACPDPSSV